MSSSDGPAEFTLSARWVFPVTAPPIAGGVVTVAGDRLTGIGGPRTRSADLDLGNAALIPGLVNAHTHLDLSDAAALRERGNDFVGWLRSVVGHRRGQTAGDIDNAIRAGIEASLRAGVTLLGDISVGGLSTAHLEGRPIDAVVFRELLGLTETRAEQAWEAAERWLDTPGIGANVRLGLSPHSPYSVRNSLFERAARADVPTAIHLAESGDELPLLASRKGPLRRFLEELGAWDGSALVADHEHLIKTFADRRTVWVHANRLPPGAVPRRVYCPRTHDFFGFEPYPLWGCVEAGELLAIGTDSLASNPDLDVLAEARFVRERHPLIDGVSLLGMITLGGAEMLGRADEVGSLTPGKRADMVAVPLPDVDSDDPHELLFERDEPTGVRRTMYRGAWR